MKRELDVQQWGKDRGITICTEEGTPRRVKAQAKKLESEYKEMVRDNDKDSIGDQFVVLSMIAGCYGTTASLCKHATRYLESETGFVCDSLANILWLCSQNENNQARQEILKEVGIYAKRLEQSAAAKGWTLESCVEVAWNDIKDRKGCMVHDTFVKESNLALLEKLGVKVCKDEGGQLVLTGVVRQALLHPVSKALHCLGYKYNVNFEFGGKVEVVTTGVAE